jgi:hypothetical protein
VSDTESPVSVLPVILRCQTPVRSHAPVFRNDARALGLRRMPFDAPRLTADLDSWAVTLATGGVHGIADPTP